MEAVVASRSMDEALHHHSSSGEGTSSPGEGASSHAGGAVVRLDLAYDGHGFHGWQVQPDRRTVQGELVRCLKRLIPLEGLPPGAGRTDRGVHARGQVASFPLSDPALFERIERALPRMVPADMAIRRCRLVPPGFHARHSARGRRYRYSIIRERNPFLRHTHLLVTAPLDVPAMEEAARALLGEHDFSSFCKASSREEGKTRCRVDRVQWLSDGPELVLEIRADRFLHSMVRVIVGTLLEIGRGRRPPEAIRSILEARSRQAAGRTAPAHGLCLEEVDYGDFDRGD